MMELIRGGNSMIEIGAFDARDQFSRLLDRVQLGEEVVITRRGKAVAKLVPDHATKVVIEQSQDHISELRPATSNSH
jgi:prevent-host-death family protein